MAAAPPNKPTTATKSLTANFSLELPSARGKVEITLDDINGLSLITPRTARSANSTATSNNLPTAVATATAASSAAKDPHTNMPFTAPSSNPSATTNPKALLLSANAPTAVNTASQNLQAEQDQELKKFASKHNTKENSEYTEQFSQLKLIHQLELELLIKHDRNILTNIEKELATDPNQKISSEAKITADKIDTEGLSSYLLARKKVTHLYLKFFALAAIKPETTVKQASNTAAKNNAKLSTTYNGKQQEDLKIILELPRIEKELDVETIKGVKTALQHSLSTSIKLLLLYRERHLLPIMDPPFKGDLSLALDKNEVNITALLNNFPIDGFVSNIDAFEESIREIKSGKGCILA